MALANWKMSMTVAESLAFGRDLRALAGDLLDQVEVVVCPAYTALWPVGRALEGSPIQLGGQDVAATADPAHTGQISAAMLANVGCRWVMLGHWEVRRQRGDDDATVNRKVHLAFEAGLAPILLVGEAHDDATPQAEALEPMLARTLAGIEPDQAARLAIVYEPESAIGALRPASPRHVAAGSGFIRAWLHRRWGGDVAGRVRIVYGGSVAPEHAAELLASPDLDGLGATRRGRNAATFASIVRQIARAKA
jgi:triosephosphate isomerase